MTESEHVWGPWYPSPVVPGSEDRKCIRCGATQRRRLQTPQ